LATRPHPPRFIFTHPAALIWKGLLHPHSNTGVTHPNKEELTVKEGKMTKKLWIASAVYLVFAALPIAVRATVYSGSPGTGLLVFALACGLYTTTVLLGMIFIDYAKR
jgi:hypothetical protein